MEGAGVVIDGFVLMTHDAVRLAGFYRAALGFSEVGPGRLQLGAQSVSLRTATGAPYPIERASNDPWFQHLAIVVSDIGAAYRCAAAHGAVAISRGGPQVLPPSSGGVTAWKFRDPDGHPLELLAFPAGAAPSCWQGQGPLFRGIDHTAIVVAETARSMVFYRQLGFVPAERSHNRGKAQAALDALADPDVLVTALRVPGQAAPHLELLDYRAPGSAAPLVCNLADVAASRTLLTGRTTILRDPDGHHVA